MPEGDSIHNVALALRPLLVDRNIDGGFTRAPNHELKPQLVTHIEAYGKHLLSVLKMVGRCVLILG